MSYDLTSLFPEFRIQPRLKSFPVASHSSRNEWIQILPIHVLLSQVTHKAQRIILVHELSIPWTFIQDPSFTFGQPTTVVQAEFWLLPAGSDG